MFSLAEMIVIFLAMESWVFLAKYLAEKTSISIINSMIISFFYSLILWGVMCLISNIFNTLTDYTISDAYNGITLGLSIFLTVMMGIICYNIRKDKKIISKTT
ncbi:hypothetical protein [Acinetobacter bereziniae]|uniref:hypothetical protein n=1 Tax=Acinetobacter bereziniae TaxID=106648 RepID=UPI00148EE3E0|nr:hypothetical protein [Acinetobacter bereziniae]